MHEVLVNRLGGLSLPRKSVGRLTDRPDMTLDVYRGRKTTMQQQMQHVTAQQAMFATTAKRPTFSLFICWILAASVHQQVFEPNSTSKSDNL